MCTCMYVLSRCVDAHVCGVHCVTVNVYKRACLHTCSVHMCVHMCCVYACVYVCVCVCVSYGSQIGKRKIERKGGQSHRLVSLDI